MTSVPRSHAVILWSDVEALPEMFFDVDLDALPFYVDCYMFLIRLMHGYLIICRRGIHKGDLCLSSRGFKLK